MTSIFLEKDSDSIYEEYQISLDEDTLQEECDYREDRMEQMISRYGY